MIGYWHHTVLPSVCLSVCDAVQWALCLSGSGVQG